MNALVDDYPIATPYVDFGIDAAFDLDPYTPLLELAKRRPVVEGKDGAFGGVPVPDNFLFGLNGVQTFLALSYDAWRQVAMDHETFSSEKGYELTLGKVFGKTLMNMDEPEHGRYKKLVLPSFSHRMVTNELAKIAEPIIDECLNQIEKQGRGELIAGFATKFPYLIVAKLFGVPPEFADESERLVVASLRMGADPGSAIAAFGQMNALYQKIVDQHKAAPQDDLTSLLLRTEVDGQKLSDEEVVSFLKQIVAAGLDTTVRQFGNLIYLLLENPEQFADLRANPDLLESAIWESLRRIAAGGMIPRIALKDTEVCGVRIPKGAGVYAVIHVANLDAIRWPDPLKFDIRRKRTPIATFGSGVHSCLGMSLAIAELSIAMRAVLSRLKNLRKDPVRWSDSVVRGYQLRSPTKLPVIWDAN
jgi:cytochrome P450